MAAILQTCGPLTIHSVLVRNYQFLRKLRVDQYLEAANNLQVLQLGTVVQVGTKSQVFIKKAPTEGTTAILLANPGLCHPEHYTERYKKSLSKSVSLGIRHQVLKMRLVPASQMM